MNEQAINDLYNLAKQNGYTKSLDEFVNLMYTNDNAFNDMYSLAKNNGYQKSQDDFSVLIGKKKSEAQPQPTAQAQPMAQKPQAPAAMASSSGAPSSASPSTEVIGEEFKGFDEEALKRMKASATEAPQMALMRHEKKAEKQREEDRAQVLAEIETWKDYKEQPYFEGELGNTIRAIPFGVGDFIDDIGRAYGAGTTQADIASPSNSLMISGPSSSSEQIKKYVEAAKALNKYGPSDEMVAFTKAIEEDNGGAWGFIKGLIQNPSVIPEVMLSSTRALFNSASGATAGTVVGGAAAGGAVFGGVGAGPAALASIPYAMGAAGATLETASSFAEFMNEELQKRGLELSEENVKTILEDEDALSSMRNRALTRGVTIGVIDAFTGRVAGRVGAKLGKGVGTAAKVKAGLASAGIEAVGGSAGEATARALAGQEMDIAEIGLEGVGEMPMATIDVAAEVLRSPRYKINGEVRNAEDVQSIINTASADELQKINFDIKNDRNGFNQQIQDKIVTNQVRNEIKDASPDIDDESLNQLTTLEMELRKVEGNKTQTGRDKANQIRSQIREVQQAAAEKKAAAIVETAPAETKPAPITAEQVALKEEEAAIAANILRAEILDDIFKDSTAQNKADALEQRMNNAEEIPMTEINDVLDGLYKQVEMVMDNYFDNEVGKQYAQALLDKIDKIKSYEFATDKETAVITERTAVQTARNTVQETASVINLARAPRRKATITSEDGTTGTYSIEVGPDGAVTFEQPDAEPIRVGNVNDVNKTAKIVETVLNEKGLPQSVSFSITDEQGKSHTIKVEAKGNLKPQQLLDLAINIRANELGTVDPTDFDTAYQEVTKEVTTTKLVSDAIQKQAAGQVPVQPTARPSEEVAQGKPQAEPQVTAQAGVQEEVSRLEQAFGGAFAPTPSGGVSAQTQKPSGISVSNREQVSELETKTTDTNKKKIIKAATTAINTLKSIFPDMDIVIHDNEGSYDSQMGQVNGRTGSAGNFAVTRTADGKIVGGRIDINLSRANMRTVAHEVAHAVMLKAFGDNPALFKVFRDRISNILSETRIKSLNDFVSQYAENDSHEEFLVELSAALGEAQEQLKPITVNKITQLINKVVSKITGGKVQPFSGIVQTNELIDFMNTMSSAIGKGEAIQVKEGETKGAAGVVSKAQVSVKDIDVKDIRTKSRSGKRVSKGLSVRTKNKVKVVEEAEDLSLDYVKKNAPEAFISNAKIIADYPIVSGIKKFTSIKTLEDAQEVYDIFSRQVADNLKYLIDNFRQDLKDIATLWYDGANILAQNFSKKYGITTEQAAGIIASLSPQKDWYQNVRLAEMVMMAFKENPVMTKEMVEKQKNVIAEGLKEYTKALNKAKLKYKKSRSKANAESLNKEIKSYEKYINSTQIVLDNLTKLIGTDMNSAPDYMKQYYVRLFHEVNTTKDYDILSPDGKVIGVAKKKDGTKAQVAWGSYTEIGKAVAIYLDGSQGNITKTLGEMHKIRNFYNNIIDPMSPDRDVTMDTHAVAAALLLPLSGKSKQVQANFGTGTANSAPFGIKGLYYAFAEGYNLAAKETGLLPRQVQSITWEAVRGLFTDDFKRDKKKVADINSIVDNYVNKKITLDEARNQITEYAGGIKDPSWAGGPLQEESTGDVEEGVVGRGGKEVGPDTVGAKRGGKGGLTTVSKAQVETTVKALEGLDKKSISNLEKLSNIYYHGNPTKKVIDKLEDRGNGIHIGTKEQAKEFLNLSGTEGTLYKVKLSAKEIIEGVDEENQANFTQKDVDELVDKYMNNGDSYMTAFNKALAELRNPFLYKNQIGKADALKYINTKEGSLSDYSIVTFNPNLTEIVSVVSYDKSGKIIIFDNTTKSIAEAYHKAKQDGSNPELVKAVEDAIGEPTVATEVKEMGETFTVSKAQVDAYHGSPYDFDRFTTEKIGTGEGAQAFGWGLYFTDLKNIAERYANKLAKTTFMGKAFDENPMLQKLLIGLDDEHSNFYNQYSGRITNISEFKDYLDDQYEYLLGESQKPIDENHPMVKRMMSDNDYSKQKIDNARNTIAKFKSPEFKEKVKKLNEVVDDEGLKKVFLEDFIKSEKFAISFLYEAMKYWSSRADRLSRTINFVKNDIKRDLNYFKYLRDNIDKFQLSKKLYQVSLHQGKTPDQYTWLVWDKPVSEKVKNIVRSKEQYLKGKINESKYITGKETESEKNRILQLVKNELIDDLINSTDISVFYRRLSSILGSDKEASLFLLENGIDGVKYPAESIARGATSDTARGFNYVVFDENAVTIVSKAQKADEEVRKVVKDARAQGYSEAAIKAFLLKKGFTEQEADALMSKPEAAKKVTMTENNLLKIKIKEYARGAKDTKTAIANATKELTDILAKMVDGGKISSAQLRTIIRKFGSLKVLNEKSLNRFFDYMTKVIADAEYSSKLENAQSLRKDIKKLSRNKEKNASMRELAKRFVDIDPSLVDDIDAYNDIAQKIKESVKGSTIREGKITQAEMVRIADSNEYISETMDAQRQKLFDEKAAEIQELLGVDVSDLSYEQLLEMVDKKEKITKYNEGLVRSAIIRMFGTYSSIIEQMFSTSKDPFTGEDIDIDPKKKELVQRFMDMDLNQLTAKQGLEAVDALTNFIQNGSTAKMEAVVSEYTGEKNAMELEEKGIKSEPLKAYKIGAVGRLFAEQFMSLPVMLERMFKGVKRASLFEKMSSLIDLRNKKSAADRKVTDIINDYVDKFYKEKANGEDFNTSYNATERGLVAFMTRNVVGTAKQMAEEFSRRKALIEESIEVLSKGTDAEKAKAELYQKAYDKLLRDSKDGDEVRSKADSKNLEAIDYWKNKWAEIYDDLSDVSENVYNTLLDKDSNYTPDRYTRLDSAGERTPLENDQSMFHGNTNTIYKKKTGVLMEAERPKQLPRFEGKKKAGMYVDLSFDRNNANSMYDALVDINTAATIRQVEAFINSESFDSIIDNPKDAKVLKGRIQQFVRNMRDKNIVESDELSKAARSLNVMATIGVGQALGGVFQPFKQTIPVIVNTMINAGKINMSIPFNTAVNDFLNNSGYAIANRGLASSAELSSIEKLAELAESSKGEKIVKALEAANKKMLEILLVKSDVAVARASWIAYYEKSLQEQGIDTKGIDYSKHELNKEAADYAQRMVDRQQNISDHDLAGKFFTSKDAVKQVFVKAVMPFASFRINQWMRMTTDLSILKSKTASKEDKRIAARSLAGFTAEMFTFKLVSLGIIMLMGTLTKALMGHDEDDEEEKKRFENAKKGQLTGTITDVFSPLPFADKPIQAGAGWLINKVQDIMGIAEEEKTTIFPPQKSDTIASLGAFGIAAERVMQLIELAGLATNGKFKDDYGNEKQISEQDMEVLKYMFGLAVLSNIGLAPTEANTIVRNSIKFAKKGGKTEKSIKAEQFSPPNGLTKEQFKRYFPEEYEEKYGEGSMYYKMTQPEREQKKKAEDEKQKLMDEYYDYEEKSKKGFGSKGFGEEKKKKEGFGSKGFGSKGFGE